MTQPALASGITVVAALGGLALFSFVKWIDHRRALAGLAALPCVHCGLIYGASIIRNISRVSYCWTPLRGNTVARMGLPSSTYLIRCPRCVAQAEFRKNGQLFVPPQKGVCGYTRQVNPEPAPEAIFEPRNLAPSLKRAKVAELDPALPILVVENGEENAVPLSRAVREAGFINPLISLPDDQSVGLYLDGVGIYSNRKKHPLPALVLEDVPLVKLDGLDNPPWLEQPRLCRHVVVTVMSGEVEARHFESAVPFGANAMLLKLESPDSMAAMFKVLRRACIED